MLEPIEHRQTHIDNRSSGKKRSGVVGRLKKIDLSSGKWSAFASILCIELAAIVNALVYSGFVAGYPVPPGGAGQNTFRPLDPAWLEELWQWNKHVFPYLMAFDFFISLGLLLLLHSAMCLKKVYRAHDGTAQDLMVKIFAVGALLPTLEFLQNLGARSTAAWLADLPETDLPLLQVTFVMSVSRMLWVFAMLYVFLAVGIVLQAYLTFATGASSRVHACVGLLTAVVGLVVFGLNVVLSSNGFGSNLFGIWGLTSLFFAMLLLPLWIVGVAFRLGDEEVYQDVWSAFDDGVIPSQQPAPTLKA